MKIIISFIVLLATSAIAKPENPLFKKGKASWYEVVQDTPEENIFGDYCQKQFANIDTSDRGIRTHKTRSSQKGNTTSSYYVWQQNDSDTYFETVTTEKENRDATGELKSKLDSVICKGVYKVNLEKSDVQKFTAKIKDNNAKLPSEKTPQDKLIAEINSEIEKTYQAKVKCPGNSKFESKQEPNELNLKTFAYACSLSSVSSEMFCGNGAVYQKGNCIKDSCSIGFELIKLNSGRKACIRCPSGSSYDEKETIPWQNQSGKYTSVLCKAEGDLKSNCNEKSGSGCSQEGDILLRSGDSENAFKFYKIACEKQKYPHACGGAGAALSAMMQTNDAVEYFEKGCDLKDSQSCALLGDLYRKTGQAALAKKFLGKACKMKHEEACELLDQE